MVITIAANIAETAILTYPACFPDSVVGFIADPTKADVRFVEYQFRRLRRQIQHENVGTGSVQDNINLQTLGRLTLKVPPLQEQIAVGSVLGALDDKIELNRRMNETLEMMARAIFKDWFVDFGPTRAKMEGRAPYLSADIWSLFPERIDGDEMPEGWSVGTVADYAALNPESWTRSNYPARIEYVDLGNIKWGTIEATKAIERDKAPSRAQRILREGDTVVGTVRPGNGSFALVGRPGLTASTGFAVLHPKIAANREATYLAATAPENIGRLSHLADGAAYPAVRPDVVLATELALPGPEITAAFHKIAAPLCDRIAANHLEVTTLAETRDYLLPKLMSGEIRVREAERIVEAAA
jgi:type I restriction enzyme S subunit